MAKLSKTGKLDGIKSWSLEALSTCPGSRNSDGSIVPVCQGCYARIGRYQMAHVQNVRSKNRADWKRPEWVDEMVEELSTENYFRWFDSGDVYCVELAKKILEVIRRTPNCKHWLPTRSYKIAKIRPVLEQINALPNAVVRYSADTFGPSDNPEIGSIVVFDKDDVPPNAVRCTAYDHTPSRCNGCRACWDKNVKQIAYIAHGHTAKRLKSAA